MKNLQKIFSRPKYYFIFPVVVVALFSTSLVKVNCPVCSGAGTLSQSSGMADVSIVSTDARILNSVQDACTSYIVTTADPIITVSNSGTETAQGYLILTLIDTDTDKTLASQDLAITVHPNAVTSIQSEITFAYNTIGTPTTDMDIQTQVYLNNVPCIACSGTGKVSLNTYFLIKSYKDTFISNVVSEQQYAPGDWTIINGQRVQVGSQAWLDWMELS